MEKLFLRLAAVVLLSVFCMSCDKDDDAPGRPVDFSATLEQTNWEGTLIRNGETFDIRILFNVNNIGWYTSSNDDRSDTFTYIQTDRIVEFRPQSHTPLMIGRWWIDSRTDNRMRLIEYPMLNENYDYMILKRIYK